MIQTADMSVSEFSAALAAANPTPGGGGAAAVTGSQAAALVSMVINFTVGKKKYAAIEEEMRGYLQRSENLRHELLSLADEDVAAFNGVAATYAMPRETDADKAARTSAMQAALKQATSVPYIVAERCLAVMELAVPVGAKGNSNVVSDAASALYLAHAALLCAIANVNINLKSLHDEAFVAEWSAKRDEVLNKAAEFYAAGRTVISAALGINL